MKRYKTHKSFSDNGFQLNLWPYDIRIKRLVILFILGLSLVIEVSGQCQVNGKIQDISGNPIAFASVLLLSPEDSLVIKGAISNEDGYYFFDQVEEVEYLLSVYLLGYLRNVERRNLECNSATTLPPITLQEAENELDEVQVTAQLPLYERKIDRLIINVQASITSAGNTVLEVLQKSPGVMVNRQSNSIMLNGKEGVTIMINNRIQRLPMEVVFQMMDGMSAANIEKIELITNPPAKYDAEGMGGIIHLIMTQSEDSGTSGNFGLLAGMNARETLGGNFNINHRKNRFSFFADYSIQYDHNIQIFESDFQINNPGFSSRFYSIMDRPYKHITHNFRTGFEYDLDSKTKMGFLVTAYQRHHKMYASSVFNNHITPDSSNYGTIDIYELNVWNHFTSNIHFIHNLSEVSSLRLDLDYNLSKNNNPSSYHLDFNFPELFKPTSELINISKVTPINMKVAGLDYSYQPSESLKFEAGVKGTFSNFENYVDVTYTQDENTIRNEELSITAFLEEDILAGYISGEWSINESIQIKGGLRFENTRTYISTANEIGVVDRNFGNFFPSFYYKKTFTDNLNFNIGYSRRIQRPTFNDLAPFVFFMDPNTFFSGNPALLPAIIEGIRTDINYRRANLSLEYNQINNPIAGFQPEVDPINKRQIFRSQNLDFQKIYSINLSLPWIINDWWDAQLNSSGFYNKLRTAHLEQNSDFSFLNFTANVTSNFKISPNFSAEITGMYQSKMNIGIWHLNPLGSVNLGLQKILNNDKGTIRLAANDIFYTYVVQLNSSIPENNVMSFFLIDPHIQSIQLNYTRNFGNKKLRRLNIKSGSEEVQKRFSD